MKCIVRRREKNFTWWTSGGTVSGLLLLLIGVLPASSFSQPLAYGRDKFLGCSSNNNVWPNLYLYWNQVTPGNDGKWESVEGARGQYNWAGLDRIYDYAMTKGIPFKDHCLVWGNQQPSWISSLDSASQRAAVRKWIDTVGHRYPSLSFIDVVNEPFHAPPVYMNALGGSGSTGWDWVITAFQWARQSCFPGVKLLLNEYNILQDYTVTTNYINLITLLKSRGLIDGIGIQGHYFEFRSHVGATSNVYTYNTGTIKANLDRLATLGLPIYISEFDIDETDDATQLAQYQIYFPIFWLHPAVKGITFWGYIQNDVWDAFPNTYLLRVDGTERPALQWMRTFITIGPIPDVPVLFSPRSIENAARKPTFVWRSSAYAKSYRLRMATDNGFNAIVRDTTLADTTVTFSTPLESNTMYFWQVNAFSPAGTSQYSTTAYFITGSVDAVGDEHGGIPKWFALSQNYPNPFNPTTNIEFQVSSLEFVSLKVLDVLGREVAALAKEQRQPGTYMVRWSASGMPSGVYFYRLQAGGFVETKKMILAK